MKPFTFRVDRVNQRLINTVIDKIEKARASGARILRWIERLITHMFQFSQ